MRGPWQSPEVLRLALDLYRDAVPARRRDHAIIASNGALAVRAGLAWPSAQLVVGHGKDGADLALIQRIREPNWVATHYDTVILGSGDGIFAPYLAALRALGIAIGVVAPIGAISRQLHGAAHFVRLIPDLSHTRVIA
jgi:hypothetical protein